MEAAASYTPIAFPPGTRQCCNTVYGPIDYAFFFFETLSAIGALVAGVQEDYPACGVSLGAFACFGAGHCLVRRYGNVAVIVNRFNQAQRAFQETSSQQRAQIQLLSGRVDDLTQTNDDLKRERNQFGKEREQFASQLDGMNEALEKTKAANFRLEETIKAMGDKLADTEKLNASLQERISDFSRQNAQFRKEIQQAALSIPNLRQAAESLQKGSGSSQLLVEDLSEQLGQTRSLVQSVFENFNKNREELQIQLSGLESERSLLSREVQRLQEERSKFQSASAAAELTIERLTQLVHDLEQQVAALTQGSHDLENEAHALADMASHLHPSNVSDGLDDAVRESEQPHDDVDDEIERALNDDDKDADKV